MTFQRTTLGLLALSLGFASCSKDDVNTPATVQLRTKMDYATLTATSPYTTSFKDASNTATVDLGTSSTRLDMVTELDSYLKTVTVTTSTPAPLNAAKLHNQYTNTAAPFTSATLNTSGVQLRDQTAASFSAANATTVRSYMDAALDKVAVASQSVAATATAGNAGRLGKYLVDANGVEQGQVIQKALIGALLLDQIDNVLLSEAALSADNSAVVTGKTYTALEHNWDLAYGYLTRNAIMTTDFSVTPKELFLAGYLNEKNSSNSPKVYLAFLKGRAAIVNNDQATLKQQADIIRTELEKTMAMSATSYLASWKSGTDLATKAHALGEGLGFLYSLRFCTTKYKADAAFSDAQLASLLSGTNGAWSLTNAQADAVISAVTAKFSL